MMRVKADVGNRETILRIEHAGEITKRGIRHALFSIGGDLKSSANTDILRKPKKGRVYIVRGPSGRKRRHVASAPGESHANLRGTLRKSIGWKVPAGSNRLDFGYGAGPETAPDYAGFVERGTRNMAPRPSLRNSIDKNIRNADVHFIKQINRRFEV